VKPHTILRATGILGIVAAYAVFAYGGVSLMSLGLAISGVVAIVAPEAVDQLPFGPNK
jgi:hypothetical protein